MDGGQVKGYDPAVDALTPRVMIYDNYQLFYAQERAERCVLCARAHAVMDSEAVATEEGTTVCGSPA